ncbi:MAG: ribonuclease HIII [candidate division Zixibacteria bacterium]|nr:ribonuclease HIII [candidate division Zixibacteria bacterium]
MENILGIDESGKGDFFGPLVIAGVLADKSGGEKLTRAGVRDSKKIADNKIIELSGWISANFIHSVVSIGPEKYNQLYNQINNLNKLLAWGHVRAESITQVAAASILARAAFLRQMEKLSALYAMVLPKGAGDLVDKAAAIFVRKYGMDALSKVAKVHFKNYKKIAK